MLFLKKQACYLAWYGICLDFDVTIGLASPCSLATRDSLSKLSLSTRCSIAWPLFILSLVYFYPLNTYIARYARVCRTEIYCAIVRKLSQANLLNIPWKKKVADWPFGAGDLCACFVVPSIIHSGRDNICFLAAGMSDISLPWCWRALCRPLVCCLSVQRVKPA